MRPRDLRHLLRRVDDEQAELDTPSFTQTPLDEARPRRRERRRGVRGGVDCRPVQIQRILTSCLGPWVTPRHDPTPVESDTGVPTGQNVGVKSESRTTGVPGPETPLKPIHFDSGCVPSSGSGGR